MGVYTVRDLPLPSNPGHQSEPGTLHWILDHPKLWGIVTLLAIALTFSPRVSAGGVWICLILAEITTAGFGASLAQKRHESKWGWSIGLSVLGLLLFGFYGNWLLGGKSKSVEPTTAMPQASSQVPTAPMPKRRWTRDDIRTDLLLRGNDGLYQADITYTGKVLVDPIIRIVFSKAIKSSTPKDGVWVKFYSKDSQREGVRYPGQVTNFVDQRTLEISGLKVSMYTNDFLKVFLNIPTLDDLTITDVQHKIP